MSGTEVGADHLSFMVPNGNRREDAMAWLKELGRSHLVTLPGCPSARESSQRVLPVVREATGSPGSHSGVRHEVASERMRVDDPAFVREQYASEANLVARKAAHAPGEGDDAVELTFAAIAGLQPHRVIEVGGGEGELAVRIVRELGAELVGIDQSERMVEIQRSMGIDARLGDVLELPFGEGEFDTAVAAWMLYHAPDLDRAVAELARVLRPGGRLVAVTNASDHMQELWDLAGRESSMHTFTFRSESGEDALLRHFARVERRDMRGWVMMDNDAIRGYAGSWSDLHAVLDALPLRRPLRVRRRSTIFVAEKTAAERESERAAKQRPTPRPSA